MTFRDCGVLAPAPLAVAARLMHASGGACARRAVLHYSHGAIVQANPGSVRPSDEELDLFGLTHKGLVRADNQDHFLVATVHPQVVIRETSMPNPDNLPLRGTRLATVIVVADGVGGTEGGSDAARLATEAITRYVSCTLRSYHTAGAGGKNDFLSALESAAFEAHASVRAEATERGHARMATTLTVSIVVWPFGYVVQVGDSRAYLYKNGKLKQITRDQTIAQGLVDQGILPKERLERSPFKHVLSSAIGAEEALPIVTRFDVSEREALILLCSDGLTKHVTDDEIAECIRTMKSSEQLTNQLLAMALERGGTDNITIAAGRAPLQK